MALRQTGRVVATAGAQVAAYAVGAKIGTAAVAAAWAAKGAALGSVAPGVGTAIGAVVGVGIGLLSCWLAGKAMEKAIGKSELDQLQDRTVNQPAKDLAIKAQQNDEILEEVLLTTKARYAEDPDKNEDLEKAYKNVVTAYQNGTIGSAAEARNLVKAENPEPAEPAQNTQITSQQQQTTTATQTAQTAQTTQTDTTTNQPKSEDSSKSESETKTKTDNSEKYKATIQKLDYVLSMLNSMNNQDNSGMQGMYNSYTNPMMFNNPFVMPNSGGFYA